MPQKRIIPKEKICHLRFGQLLYNSIRTKYPKIYMNKAEIADKVWILENDDLEKIVQAFLKQYSIKTK